MKKMLKMKKAAGAGVFPIRHESFEIPRCPTCGSKLKTPECPKCGQPMILFTPTMCREFYSRNTNVECVGQCDNVIHWFCVQCQRDEHGDKLHSDKVPDCWQAHQYSDDDETDESEYIEE